MKTMTTEVTTLNIGAVLSRAAQLWPDRPGVIDGDRTLTFAALDDRANRLAAALCARGLQPGDRVAVLVGNRAEWFDATFGLAKAGLVRCYINPRSAPAEVAHQIADSDAKAIVLAEEHGALLDASDLSDVQLLETGHRYEALLEATAPMRGSLAVAPSHLLEIKYTSGSTGVPKGVPQTHGAYMAKIQGELLMSGVTERDVYLHSGPMTYGGFAYQLLAVGAPQIIQHRFDAEEVVAAIAKDGVTTLLLVPSMLYMLIDAVADQNVDLSSLRTAIYGAAPIAPHRLEQALDLFGQIFVQSYGMSEAVGCMAILPKADHVIGDERLTSCGRPTLVGEVMIADEDGVEVPRGEVGEIVMRGPTVMTEYWNRPEETAAAFTPQGWFRSKDLAYMDEHGYIYIVDRKADMIISGGFNVYPAEVEHALLQHPAVAEAAVIPVPDEKWGESVKAVVRLHEGSSATEADLMSWARERVAAYKSPRSVDFVTEPLPTNPNGKLVRGKVREPYWEGRTRRVG